MRPLVSQYDRKRDGPRVCGLALEVADKARASQAGLPAFVVLNPKTPAELIVTATVEPLLPRVLGWAAAAKAHVDGELERTELALVRGPFGFRGPGPRASAGAAIGGVQTTAVVASTGVPLNVDLRFALRDTDAGGKWWSALVEQKFSGVLERAEEAARNSRDGKILAAAKDARFELGEGGRPVTARAGACGALAVSPEAWSFAVEPRTEHWFPAGLRRDGFRRPFPLEVRTLFPAGLLQGAAGGGAKAPAPQKARVKVPVQQKGPAQAPAQAPSKTPQKTIKKKAAAGGRAFQKQDFRMVRGRRSPKQPCAGACSYVSRRVTLSKGARKGRATRALVCSKCNRRHRDTQPPRKFSVVRCTKLGLKCTFSRRAATCRVCKRKPAN